MISAGSNDYMMASHVVLVYWPSIDIVLVGINP